MEKFYDWWHGHEPREQMILAVGGIILAILVFIFFVLVPVADWHAKEKKLLEQSRADVSEVKTLASKINANKKSGNRGKTNQSLAVLIDNSIRENKLVMRGFQPGNKKDARLRLENAAYPELSQWLYDLEYRHSVTIEELSLTPSKLEGRLMVSLRVAQ